MTKLGDKIKTARKAQKITQQQLADRLGVHRSTVANYELTRRKPSITEIKAIASILHIDVNYLLEGEEVEAKDELITRATTVFNDLDLTKSDKDAIFHDIMEIYMKGKNLSDTKSTVKENRKLK